MKIKVRNIPLSGGLDLAFDVPCARMKASLAHEDDLKEGMDKPVVCQLHLDVLKQDVYVTGLVSTSLHPTCGRCGERFDWPLHLEVSLTCTPRPARGQVADIYQESEDGLIYFSHDELDLDEIVREQVFLTLPIKYLCQENCRGLCPGCGENLNLSPQPHTCKVPKTVL